MVYRPRVLPWSTDRGVLRPCVQVVCTRSCVQGRVYKAVCTRQCVQVVVSGRVYRPRVQDMCTGHVYRTCVQATFTKVACSRVYRSWCTGVVYRPRVLKLRVQITCSNRIAMPCHRAAMRTIPDRVGLNPRCHCHPAVLARLVYLLWSNSLAPLAWPNARKCWPGSHRLYDAWFRPRHFARCAIYPWHGY